MTTWLKIFLPYGLMTIFGATLVFAFAPFNLYFIALLAPAGFLALILDTPPKAAAWRGYCFGIGMFAAGIHWLYIAIHLYGEVPAFLSVLLTAAAVLYLAFYPAAVAYFTSRYFPTTSTKKILFAFPAIWVAVEWVRSWLFTGFPWLFIGYSQTDSFLRGFAPVLSVYGVSLTTLMTSGCLLNAYLSWKQRDANMVLRTTFILVALWFGGSCLTQMQWSKPQGEAIHVNLVQGNIPQSLKWSPDHVYLSFERYANLTNPLWKNNQLIIWPEAAIPMTLQDAAEFIEELDKRALASHSELIMGIPMQNPHGEGYFNSVVTLGAQKNSYLKRRLVPFGDYVPMQMISSFVFDFIHVPISGTIPGKFYQPFLLFGKVKLLTAICFEVAFPEVMFTKDPNVGLLLTVTNDAWFNESIAKPQHLQMAVMRALELQRPMIFASNDGISAIITAKGNIQSSAPAHVPYVLRGNIQPMIGATPWMKLGIDRVLLLLVAFLIMARRKSVSEKNNGTTIQPAAT